MSEDHPSKRVFVMRHGERCDFTFGKCWVDQAFNSQGIYTQLDINLPTKLIQRKDPKEFLLDSPLTEVGKFHAKATGEALKKVGISVEHIYVSPSLRCVETAQGVIDGMANGAQMCIEPTAFEWCGWYKSSKPKWLPASQLKEFGFDINTDHCQLQSEELLDVNESVEDYYNRCHSLVKEILKKHEHEGGDILIVAHAASLDTFTRGLQGKPPLNAQAMQSILHCFSYCCFCSCAQTNNRWELQNPPIPPLHTFDWKVMLRF